MSPTIIPLFQTFSFFRGDPTCPHTDRVPDRVAPSVSHIVRTFPRREDKTPVGLSVLSVLLWGYVGIIDGTAMVKYTYDSSVKCVFSRTALFAITKSSNFEIHKNYN